MRIEEPRVLGGVGDKLSNGGTQYYQQRRIYSSDGLAMCLPANLPGGSYWYLIKEIHGDNKNQTSNDTRVR